MKSITFSLFLAFVIVAYASDRVTVVGDDDLSPVVGATVISNSGLIIGITDNHGAITVNGSTDVPLSIRSLGFEPVIANALTDTVRLTPATYPLSEVVVNPEDRPVTKLTCYAREYMSGTMDTDTMQMYSEYMLEAFLADGKVKGYSKYDAQLYPCNISRYARFSSATGLDSVARPTYNDDVSALSFWINVAYVPGTTSDIQESIKNGADADTVQGRYSPKTIYRKKNSIYTISHDLLGDHKNHTLSPLFLKLLGLTMEISQLNHSLAYNLSDTSHYGLYDFIYSTYNIHALTKGKWFKKILGMKDFIDMDCYIELYPVDIERCTVDEYKERKKDRSCVSFKYSENMLPLSSAVQNLVDRVNREIPVK